MAEWSAAPPPVRHTGPRAVARSGPLCWRSLAPCPSRRALAAAEPQPTSPGTRTSAESLIKCWDRLSALARPRTGANPWLAPVRTLPLFLSRPPVRLLARVTPYRPFKPQPSFAARLSILLHRRLDCLRTHLQAPSKYVPPRAARPPPLRDQRVAIHITRSDAEG